MSIRGTLREVPFTAYAWYGKDVNKFEWKFVTKLEISNGNNTNANPITVEMAEGKGATDANKLEARTRVTKANFILSLLALKENTSSATILILCLPCLLLAYSILSEFLI